jgi:hypothetical protein
MAEEKGTRMLIWLDNEWGHAAGLIGFARYVSEYL